MEGKIENIERIEELVEKGQIDSVSSINYVFKLWLRNYLDEEKVKVEENIKEGLKPSITVFDERNRVLLVWQNVDPDTDLSSKKERKKLKAIALSAYAKVLLPEMLLLSNGRALYLYNRNLKGVLQIPSLKKINQEEKKELLSLFELM